jgi:DHA2 family multidrug resistance protein-like MFS transporter
MAQVVGFEWAFMGSTALAFVALILSLFLSSPKREKEMTRQANEEQKNNAPAK